MNPNEVINEIVGERMQIIDRYLFNLANQSTVHIIRDVVKAEMELACTLAMNEMAADLIQPGQHENNDTNVVSLRPVL